MTATTHFCRAGLNSPRQRGQACVKCELSIQLSGCFPGWGTRWSLHGFLPRLCPVSQWSRAAAAPVELYIDSVSIAGIACSHTLGNMAWWWQAARLDCTTRPYVNQPPFCRPAVHAQPQNDCDASKGLACHDLYGKCYYDPPQAGDPCKADGTCASGACGGIPAADSDARGLLCLQAGGLQIPALLLCAQSLCHFF